ncbi:NADP-dependent malic enzyme [Cichlidogyrus casuarinus]|uniref:NADP-dependent malic enzyme n=1 Tax=Cichlidogyrus casuarinus TaxID=1844966 RepID=A0ABD2PNS4_9PLAT
MPGLMLALTSFGMQKITEEMVISIAQTISNMVSDEELKRGSMYPPVSAMREVSHQVALKLMEMAYAENLATYQPEPENKEAFLAARDYQMNYHEFVPDTYPWPANASQPK